MSTPRRERFAHTGYQQPRQQQRGPRKTDLWRTADNRPLCFHCGEADHVYRRCPYRELGLRGYRPNDPRPKYGQQPREIEDYLRRSSPPREEYLRRSSPPRDEYFRRSSPPREDYFRRPPSPLPPTVRGARSPSPHRPPHLFDDLAARFHPWLPRAPRHRPPTLRTVATWTVVEADPSVGWVSRHPWELQPRPERGDPAADVPEPFRGRLVSDRHPQERPSIYTAEELRRLCPYCRVPQIHVPTHLTGSLDRDCMTATIAASSASAGPRTEDSVAGAFALLLHHRPDLLHDPLPADHVIDMPDES
ncbi:hypothetical protein HPB48_016862 [Haemaphysalis longicornis]|uniref:CCHC-type domain-containing protein n=1 Tax=Haemaphysalis longicornis TaxID=44386 RepID=A0A9J6GW71_HAELO|nr:hypothetical protein HPB48_016862 [Haemaphysalis longicornis]